MTQPLPTTLPEALAELALVKSELERWRRLTNQKIQEKEELKSLLRGALPYIKAEHPRECICDRCDVLLHIKAIL